MTPAQGAAVTYTAYASGRVHVDLKLVIMPDGQAELELGSSASLRPEPADTVGYFAGSVPQEEIVALLAYIDQHQLGAGSTQPPPPSSPEMVSRSLTVTREGKQTQVSLDIPDPEGVVDGLEQQLMQIANRLVAQPQRAVRLTLSLAAERSKVKPLATLTNVGSEPLELVLYEKQEGRIFAARTLVLNSTSLPSGGTMWTQLDAAELEPRQLEALVRKDALPRGAQSMKPGQSYTFELPTVSRPSGAPEAQIVGVIEFWLSGPGPARRLATLRSAPAPLSGVR